jgi:hypothetical protein
MLFDVKSGLLRLIARMIGLTACIAAGVNYYLKSVALFIAIHWHRVIQRIRSMRIAFMAVNFPISPLRYSRIAQ